jgi:hypothetical protein
MHVYRNRRQGVDALRGSSVARLVGDPAVGRVLGTGCNAVLVRVVRRDPTDSALLQNLTNVDANRGTRLAACHNVQDGTLDCVARTSYGGPRDGTTPDFFICLGQCTTNVGPDSGCTSNQSGNLEDDGNDPHHGL